MDTLTTYILNSNYRLLEDKKRAIIISGEAENIDSEIDYSPDFISMIHPLHAQILSFFSGQTNYEETIQKITSYLHMDRHFIEDFIAHAIHNSEPFQLLSNGNIIKFPKNLLIQKEDNKSYPSYNCSQFPMVADVDLHTQRFYKPRYFSFVLTTNCFTDCIYCYADRVSKVKNYLPTSRILELIDEMIAMDALKIDFDGGEVLLHPDHITILSYAISKGFMPYISTKCPLSLETVRKLKNIGIHKIQISLDSSNPKLLSSLLCTKDHYLDKMTETISFFAKENIEIVIHCILTRNNCAPTEILKLIKTLLPFANIKEINIDPAGFSLFKNKYNFSAIKVTEQQIYDIRQIVSTFDCADKIIQVKDTQMLCSIYHDKNKKEKAFKERPKCEGNVSALFIMPDGKVTICEEMYWHPNFILGDVTENSIMEVWNSPKGHYLANIPQESISAGSACRTCELYYSCRGVNIDRICWKEVQYFYGRENWDYPHPSCPFAPPPLNDCLLEKE